MPHHSERAQAPQSTHALFTHTPALQQTRVKQQQMTRAKALRRAAKLLSQEVAQLSEAVSVLDGYGFHPDELTEAGVHYEVVRALEQHKPTLLSK